MNEISTILAAIHPSFETLRGLPLFVFLLVVVLTGAFLLGYLIKGTQVWFQLRAVVRGVRQLRTDSNPPAPSEVGKLFKWEPLKHLWDEYEDTLHELRIASSGDVALKEVRATVPAETMFTREVLVDSRLFDDFTRHLPGVLTGLGIIGTFAGLLDGLKSFDPSNTAKAVEGLAPLMAGVQHAFVASGMAIACAMAVVFISRFTLAYLYRLVEHLTHGVDSLYSTGAGEEYLSRLVKSSEQNAASTAQLKDALVEDLNKMMTNLVERQIVAQEASSIALGKHIGESISNAIAEPMKRVGDAMEVTARGNGEQVNSMLESLLTGFMAKLDDTFGGQMRGINEQMQRSMDAMASVQASLQSLLADIKSTNEQATNQMSGTLEEAMKKSADNQQLLTEQMREFVQDFRRLVTEEQNKSKQAMDDAAHRMSGTLEEAMKKSADNQQLLTDQMREFVQDFRRLVTEEQSKSKQAMDEAANGMSGTLETSMKKAAENQQLLTNQIRDFVQEFRYHAAEEQDKSKQVMDKAVAAVLDEVKTSVGHLDAVRKDAAAEELERNTNLANHTNLLIGGLTSHVQTLLNAVSEQVTRTQRNIDELTQVSTRAIDGMNNGALTMGSAAQRFETAGNSVTTVFDRSMKVADTLSGAATSLQTASSAIRQGFDQYDSTRKTVDAQVASLMGLIESAKREAGVSKELVTSLHASADAMRRSEAESREHLDKVNDALVKAFTDFGNSLVSQVKSTIAETDRHLAQGTGHLNGVVQELANAVQRMKRA